MSQQSLSSPHPHSRSHRQEQVCGPGSHGTSQRLGWQSPKDPGTGTKDSTGKSREVKTWAVKQ